jgi:hypothetical protein
MSVSKDDMLDGRKSSFLSSSLGPPRYDPILVQIRFIGSRIIGSFSSHTGFVLFLLLFRVLGKRVDGIGGIEMGFSTSGVQTQAVEVSEEEVDVLVGSMRRGGIDKHDRCERIGRWLKEV